MRSEHGALLSQKQEPKLCLIRPSIDPRTWTLTLAAEGKEGGVVLYFSRRGGPGMQNVIGPA